MFPGELVGLFMLLGGGSPTIAAVIVMYLQHGGDGSKSLFDAFKRKFSPVWLAIAIVLVFVTFYSALTIFNLLLDPGTVPVLDLLFFTLYLFQMFFMNIWEEIGWRGYAQSALQERYNVAVSSIIVGVI